MRLTISISTGRAMLFGSLMAVVFGITSGFQIIGISRDYANYQIYFDFARNSPLHEVLSYRFEPGFAVLVCFLTALPLCGGAVYSAIAGASIFIKYAALKSTKNFWTVSIVFTLYYATRYFTLFEMTVLRSAVALSIVFFVFYSRTEYEYRAKHICLLLVAASMHFSAIIFIPIYLVRPLSRITVATTGAAFFVAILAAKNLAIDVLPNYIPVFATYTDFTEATLLPIPFTLDIVFLVFVLLNWDKNDFLMKSCALGMAISVAVHFSSLEFSMLASRFRELLSVFYLLYVVRAVGCTRGEMKYITVAYGVVSASLYLYANYIHDPLLI